MDAGNLISLAGMVFALLGGTAFLWGKLGKLEALLAVVRDNQKTDAEERRRLWAIVDDHGNRLVKLETQTGQGGN